MHTSKANLSSFAAIWKPTATSMDNSEFLIKRSRETKEEMDVLYNALNEGVSTQMREGRYYEAMVFFQQTFPSSILEEYLDVYKEVEMDKINCDDCKQAMVALILNTWTIRAGLKDFGFGLIVEGASEIDQDDIAHFDPALSITLERDDFTAKFQITKEEFTNHGDLVWVNINGINHRVSNLYLTQFINDQYHGVVPASITLQ